MENDSQFDKPILFMIYHRPDITRQVFAEIRKQRPKQLFISAGAPKDIPGDQELCDETKRVTESIDWDCEVYRLYEETNVGGALGCKNALDWFFDHVDEGIVLEDDCMPHPSFFRFCAEMLSRYRNDPHVMLVSGDNFLSDKERKVRQNTSYYFSLYPLTWGWATWKRVWKLYDYEMKTLPTKSDKVRALLQTDEEREYWFSIFKKEYYKKNAWDYQLVYALWFNDGICITPTVNLISNIGFGEGAANTTNPNHPAARQPTENMAFPLIHPVKMTIDVKADSYVFKHHYLKTPGFKGRVKKVVLAYAPRLLIQTALSVRKNFLKKI